MTEENMIYIEHSKNKKKIPPNNQLGFGTHFTDHMFMMNYSVEEGWHQAKIMPYQPLTLDPASKVFHYGQAIFEGLKAYRAPDGRILLFRPQENIDRMNRSNERMSIPKLDTDVVLNALKQLIKLDENWIPTAPGMSLYIRPFVIATQAVLGVAPSEEYKFIIIMSPVGAYYGDRINPIKIFVESQYVRAVEGGVGEAKAAGNYGATFKSQKLAKEQGYSQVMWLDGIQHKYVEEVGSMNVFFNMNGTIVTPALSGSILAGITRNSVIQLLTHWGLPVEERKISINEIYESGHVSEAFGTGTAVVIAPIGEMYWNGQTLLIAEGSLGALTQKVYDTLTGIQNGAIEDLFGWTMQVN
ncbi:branched-chain amino acid aminotransferase [Paenibacillus sp. GSMTC-2017]|uniref:branched-chain amino acid aminotransferase n=1 Tax=Paenibacillus sp. GSMTC-2017 TaxID=2794350 RepID=UPI0018D8615D|nr:branched-chain amino acid aminotransferase [Paenibacillus sp. GSMTC-2017]MBH5318404.1 branched-chain amino acid aminotransferase [Paenibacillus sp. GSMTC-2017]